MKTKIENMKGQRFKTLVRFYKRKALPYLAFITDNTTGMKFSNSFDTKEQANNWIDRAKQILTRDRF